MSRYTIFIPATLRPEGFHRLLLGGLTLCLAAASLAAQPVSTPHVDAELVAEVKTVQPGRPFHAALRLVMEDGWHTYWRNPGDAGMPTSIEWTLPEGFSAGEIQWPAPELLGKAPEVSYGYSGEILLPVEITPPADLAPGKPVRIAASASWLVCKEICIPGGADLALDLVAGSTPSAPDAGWSSRIAAALARVPAPLQGWSAHAWRDDDGFTIWLRPEDGSLHLPGSVTFFAGIEGIIDHSAPQEIAEDGEGVKLRIARSSYASTPAERLQGVLYAPAGWDGEGKVQVVEIDLPVESPAVHR